MSLDLLLQCWREGEPSDFGRSDFDDAFGGHITERTAGFARIDFGNGIGCDAYIADGERCHELAVNGPGGEEFLDALLALAARTGSAIFWAGGPPALAITDVVIARHLPPDMIDTLGPPRIVVSGRDLMDAIEGSSGRPPDGS